MTSRATSTSIGWLIGGMVVGLVIGAVIVAGFWAASGSAVPSTDAGTSVAPTPTSAAPPAAEAPPTYVSATPLTPEQLLVAVSVALDGPVREAGYGTGVDAETGRFRVTVQPGFLELATSQLARFGDAVVVDEYEGWVSPQEAA